MMTSPRCGARALKASMPTITLSFSQIPGHIELLGIRKARSWKHLAQRKKFATRTPSKTAKASPKKIKTRSNTLAPREILTSLGSGLRIDGGMRADSFRPVSIEGEAGND